MHLYFATRGINQQVDIWKMFMQTQMFPWKRTNLKTKKEETTFVQGSLRPVQLWEYVFPEESLQEVLAMMNLQGNEGAPTGLSSAKMAMIRKALQCKPIPKLEEIERNRFVNCDGVSIHPIGIKKDRRIDWEEIGYNQELL